jgi:DeoR/GlpR family transcriptional regulator of sugar metabolism
MLTTQRKDYILKVLKDTGQVIAKTVAQELQLSEDTIRRDLRELAAEGRLQRVHGGALPSSPAVVNFAGREQLAPQARGRANDSRGAGGDSRWRHDNAADREASCAGSDSHRGHA